MSKPKTDFNSLEFEGISKEVGRNSFFLSAGKVGTVSPQLPDMTRAPGGVSPAGKAPTVLTLFETKIATLVADLRIGQQTAAQLPWFHIDALIFVRALPEPLDTCLPTIEELETGLSRELDRQGEP